MEKKVWRRFDVGEHDDEAIFPMKKMGDKNYVIILKRDFKVFETDSTYVLEEITPTQP